MPIPSTNELFEQSRDMLRYNFGLNLSLIELIMLKHEVPSVIGEMQKSQNPRDIFNPDEEVALRFLNKHYDIPFGWNPAIQTSVGNIDEGFVEYLQREQLRRHAP